MSKRLISLLLVLVMVISLGGVSFAFADNETTGETVEVTDETGGSTEGQSAESQETESQETESQETESQETESQETESQETESQEAESQETESQEVESQETTDALTSTNMLTSTEGDTSVYDDLAAQLAALAEEVYALTAEDTEALNEVYSALLTIEEAMETALTDGSITSDEYNALIDVVGDINDYINDPTGIDNDKTLTVDASAEEVEGETYPTIQAAINYINTQEDKTGWTITVETGTYKRFTVLSGLDGLTIQAAEGASVTVSTWDGTESEDGSVPKRQESYYLYNGIYIMSQNVTLTGLTINVGWDVDVSYATTLRTGLSDFDLPNSSCWYVAGIRTTKADSADGLVIDSCHFTSSKQGDDSNTNYGVLTACHTFTVKNTTFDGFWQGISVMGDYYAVNDVSIAGNTFTYCNRAISVYYKVAPADTSNMGTLSITNNTITGSSDVRSKIILHDVSSNGSMGNVIMSGNTFNYGFVLIVNFAESPDTINGATVASGEAKTAVFADNTWGKGSFYVESSEYYNSSSGYTGTITVDSPELAYYESPASDEGYWALNVDLDSSPYTGSYANPEGTTEYVISVIKEANEAGSHTLAFTFDDEEQLIWTLTAFKDAIYWVSSDTTSVTVTKTWDDAEDQDGIRPESVTVELCKNGEATGVTAELSEENDWTYTFTGLATVYYDGLDENGNVVLADNEYTVEEAAVTGYTTAITGSAAAGYTVTNSHTPETTSVTVTKAWDDGADQDGLQPESVTVTLYAGGTEAATATLNEDNGWTYTFTGLAKYSAGTEIEYTVEEAAVTGYTSVITGSAAEGYVITNSHTPEQTTEETTTPSPTPTETPTDEPTETPTETEPTDTDATATPVVVTPVPTGTAPTTGDESNVLLWLGLLLLCACGAVAVTIVRKRKDQ